MNLSEINWDLNVAGTWPLPVKIGSFIFVCLMVVGVGTYFDTMEQLAILDSAEQKEQTLKLEFENKHRKSVNLNDYKNQLAQIEASLAEMIRQMPTEAEIASLLVDISQTGLASGLEFKLFKPEASVSKDFYSELPINIEVAGKYQELGLFVSGLASLPRIVTLHNVNIAPQAGTDGVLVMSAVVKTYNEGGEIGAKEAEAKKKRGRK